MRGFLFPVYKNREYKKPVYTAMGTSGLLPREREEENKRI